MNKLNNKHIFSALILCIAIISIYVTFNNKNNEDNEILSDNDCITLSDWTLESDGNSAITLPQNFEYNDNKIVLSKVLDYDDFRDVPHIMMITKYFDYNVYLDDELIFSYENPKTKFTNTNGTQIRTIHMGDNIKGKTLKLEINPIYGNAIKYYVGAPTMGSKSDLIWNAVKGELFNVTLDISVMLVGFILLLMYLIVRRNYNGDKMFYLGMLSLVCGIYMCCQFRITHILAPNSYWLYYIEYAALNTIPVVVAMFVSITVKGLPKKICFATSIIMIANIVLQNILNFVFKIEFKELLWMTHILILLLTAVVISIMFIFRKEKDIVQMIISLIPPIVGGVIDLVMIYTAVKEKNVLFFPIGLYMFITIQAMYSCRQYFDMNKKRMETEIYKRLAFTDGLTGLYNRLAFENDINKRIDEEEAACISIDLNNLKRVNDTMGHSAGDVLITGIAQILKEAVGKLGKTYRIGGDEFVVLLENFDHNGMDKLLERLEHCKQKYNNKNKTPIDYAFGVSYNDDEDTSFEKIVLRADKIMYKNKRETKAQQN